jgi:hypothetical protein
MRSILLALLASFASTLANAQTVHVPADYPTIQAAIDAGASEIFVADGTYPETLSVGHPGGSADVQLLAEIPVDKHPIAFPTVAGLNVTYEFPFRTLYVRGFRFTGPVFQDHSQRGGEATFEVCRFDSGFRTEDDNPTSFGARLRGCISYGEIFMRAYGCEVTNCTVIGAGIIVKDNWGGAGWVRDNYVQGPASIGIQDATGEGGGTHATDNVVRDTENGILIGMGIASGNLVKNCSGYGIATEVSGGTVQNNVVQDCGGNAYVAYAGVSPRFIGNTAVRCGGNGILGNIDCDNYCVRVLVRHNTLSELGQCGIHLGTGGGDVDSNTVQKSGSDGIWLEGRGPLAGNVVLDSGGDGIRCVDRADSNVVGRSASTGIVAARARGNTSYLNGGSGYELSGADSPNEVAPDTINNNIGYGNRGYGLVWTGAETPLLECNDWFGNVAGDVSGAVPGDSDLAVDPSFCDLTSDDVTLAASSLLMNQPACGLIGARGVGCSDPLSASASPTERDARLLVFPAPAAGTMAFRWKPSPVPGRLEVFDVHGARRFRQDVPVGAATLRWNGKDVNGAPIAPGVYFARLSRGAETFGVRVVLSR